MIEEFRNARTRLSSAGLNGTGISDPEKADIATRLAALEASTPPVVIGDLTDVDTAGAAEGDHFVYQSGKWKKRTPMPSVITASLKWTIGGGGEVISAGVKDDLHLNFPCTITRSILIADQIGDIQIDVWAHVYNPSGPGPSDADSITGTSPPVLSSQSKRRDETLTGWTLALPADTHVRINVDSVSAITRVTLQLDIEREV